MFHVLLISSVELCDLHNCKLIFVQ